MTREEAIAILRNQHRWTGEPEKINEVRAENEALYMAIKALEQEPFINKPCVSEKVCEHDKNNVLDKIRAEIDAEIRKLEWYGDDAFWDGVNAVSDIIDKYKAESENKE